MDRSRHAVVVGLNRRLFCHTDLRCGFVGMMACLVLRCDVILMVLLLGATMASGTHCAGEVGATMDQISLFDSLSTIMVSFLFWVAGIGLLSLVEVIMHYVTGRFVMHNLSALAWLHHGQDFGEALAVARNSLWRLSEGQAFPNVIINWLGQQIDHILLATCAVYGTDIFFSEHGRLLLWYRILARDNHIVQALNILFDGCKLLLDSLFVWEHLAQLVKHVLQSLHHASF